MWVSPRVTRRRSQFAGRAIDEANARATVRSAALWACLWPHLMTAAVAGCGACTRHVRGSSGRCDRACNGACACDEAVVLSVRVLTWWRRCYTNTVATRCVAQAAERAIATSEAARNAATARATVRGTQQFWFSGRVRAFA